MRHMRPETPAVLQEAPSGVTGHIERRLYGVPVYLSSQLSITETQGSSSVASSIYCYDASQVVVVMRSQTRVEKDSSRLFNSDQSEIRAIMRADLVVPNPKAVVRVLGSCSGPHQEGRHTGRRHSQGVGQTGEADPGRRAGFRVHSPRRSAGALCGASTRARSQGPWLRRRCDWRWMRMTA